MSENIHKGHRNRLKEEVLAADLTNPKSPDKLLEMLLFYGIPQKDTAPIARELIARFGDFSGVLDADIDDLLKTKGMTRNAASLIKLMRPIGRTYVLTKFGEKETLKNYEDIGNYVLTRYYALSRESFSLLCLNRLGKVISFEEIMGGNIDIVGVSIRTILEKVLKSEATAVVVAHNHPGGVALPSGEDAELTKRIKVALDTISVNLVDHIIIADNDYVSMALTKEFENIFKAE